MNEKVIEGLKGGSGYFTHGQTYQSMPVSCAAALEVQRIVHEKGYVANVARMGKYLEFLLQDRLGDSPYVGDIRGRGLFWAVEFVSDKVTKKPFPSHLNIAKRMGSKGLESGFDISLFAATGSADGWLGDHFLLAPPYIVNKGDIEEIVHRVVKVVDAVFEDLRQENLLGAALKRSVDVTNGGSRNVNRHDDGVINGIGDTDRSKSDGHDSGYNSSGSSGLGNDAYGKVKGHDGINAHSDGITS